MAILDFIGERQYKCLLSLYMGEEGEYFKAKVNYIRKIIARMPGPYESEGLSKDEKRAHLHYFTGDCDWYIFEKDSDEDDGDSRQIQCFGFACLNGDEQNAELGYVSISELLKYGAELDLYYNRETMRELLTRYGK